MLKHTVFILLFLVPYLVSAQNHHSMQMEMSPQKNIYLKQMDVMMMAMEQIPATTSADRDFLQMMVPHHQGAVEMSSYEIMHGHSKEMAQLAKSIKAEQLVQIQQMQLLLQNAKSFVATGGLHKKANQLSMEVMMQQMPKEQQLVNKDKSFAKVMLPHHQAAIDMAKTELQYGADKNVKRLAENIISDEQVEIEQMKLFLKINKPQP